MLAHALYVVSGWYCRIDSQAAVRLPLGIPNLQFHFIIFYCIIIPLQIPKQRGIFRCIASGNTITTADIVDRIIDHRYA